MHKGTVVNLKSFNSVFVFLKKNWCSILLSLCFVLGISFGTFNAEENEKLNYLAKNYLIHYMSARTEGSFFTVFSASLLLSAAFLIIIFAAGTSVIGVTLVPILTMLRGVIFGALVSILYSQYELKGIAFNALILIPPTLISVLMMIFAGRESILFSLKVIHITLPQSTPENLSYSFGFYCKRYLIYLIFTLVSALLDGWLSIKLISFFNLT